MCLAQSLAHSGPHILPKLLIMNKLMKGKMRWEEEGQEWVTEDGRVRGNAEWRVNKLSEI